MIKPTRKACTFNMALLKRWTETLWSGRLTWHVEEASDVRINSSKKEFNQKYTKAKGRENNLLCEEQQRVYHKCLQDGYTCLRKARSFIFWYVQCNARYNELHDSKPFLPYHVDNFREQGMNLSALKSNFGPFQFLTSQSSVICRLS